MIKVDVEVGVRSQAWRKDPTYASTQSALAEFSPHAHAVSAPEGLRRELYYSPDSPAASCQTVTADRSLVVASH